jgi:hypothetical protein
MLRNRTFWIVVLIIAAIAGYYIYNSYFSDDAQVKQNGLATAGPQEGTMLVTIVLKPSNGKTLAEIQKSLNETGFYRNFPPAGTQIESWKIVMGLGQVITLSVPPSKLRDVNIAVEKMTWGPYTAEFYPSYDFMPIYKAFRDTTSQDTVRNNIQE